MSGRVLLFRGMGLGSALIRWQTRSKYSHAAILLSDNTVVESWQGAGVRVTRIHDWHGIDAFTVIGMTPLEWSVVEQFIKSQIGKKYDYLSVARFITRRKGDCPERWFCSELVFSAFLHAGVKLLDRVEPWEVSPGLLSFSPLLREDWNAGIK